MNNICWLVVLSILNNMKVNGKDDIPYIMENKKCMNTQTSKLKSTRISLIPSQKLSFSTGLTVILGVYGDISYGRNSCTL
jgi:hypothetical protein